MGTCHSPLKFALVFCEIKKGGGVRTCPLPSKICTKPTLILRGWEHAHPPSKLAFDFFNQKGGGGWEHAHPPLKFAICFFEFEGGWEHAHPL